MSSKHVEFARRVLDAFAQAGHTTDAEVGAAGGPSSTWMTRARRVAEGQDTFPDLRSDTLGRIDAAANWMPGSAKNIWIFNKEPLPRFEIVPQEELEEGAGSLFTQVVQLQKRLSRMEEKVRELEERREATAAANTARIYDFENPLSEPARTVDLERSIAEPERRDVEGDEEPPSP